MADLDQTEDPKDLHEQIEQESGHAGAEAGSGQAESPQTAAPAEREAAVDKSAQQPDAQTAADTTNTANTANQEAAESAMNRGTTESALGNDAQAVKQEMSETAQANETDANSIASSSETIGTVDGETADTAQTGESGEQNNDATVQHAADEAADQPAAETGGESSAETAGETTAETGGEGALETTDEPAAVTANESAKDSAAMSAAKGATKAAHKHRGVHAPQWWVRYKQTKFYQIWDKRIKFSYGAYAVVFIVVTLVMDMFQLWGTAIGSTYDPNGPSLLHQVFKAEYIWLSSTSGWLNMIGLALIYLAVICVINRFWVATGIFGAVMTVFGIANKIKIALRNEPIIPSDLLFISGGQGGEITSFVSDDMKSLVNAAIWFVVWYVIICFALQFIDKRRAFIYCSWMHPIRNAKNICGTLGRILAAVLSVVLLVNYAWGLSDTESASYRFTSKTFGYSPKLWNALEDAQASGTVSTFLSLTKMRAMEKPDAYSEQEMNKLAATYRKQADAINEQRNTQLTDNTVIAILSESFSDPTRVPGITMSEDPIPFVRQLKNDTTSGIMLSSGYGGGTANLEYQELTGQSMAVFDPSMLAPYQQLVPKLRSIFTFNQMWNRACGSEKCSVAFHPYQKNFYMRDSNYKKFQFSYFRTQDTQPPVTHQDTLENSWVVSDEAAYRDVLDEVKSNDLNQFVQLITMQNHAPYTTQYPDDTNQFVAANTSQGLSGDEKHAIDVYTKGINYTDKATEQFLNELNTINKPITVIFYGDHLPGIYSTAQKNPANDLALHETDYFIWSNTKARETNKSMVDHPGQYSTSNYFMAQTATHLNAKVSPYLALLTELHQAIPAMVRIAPTDGKWAPGDTVTVIDKDGNLIPESQLDEHAKQLLHDYTLVQYDMTVGNRYLEGQQFLQLPDAQ
ncbi:LTA synthase family protein [Bifidobacterium gallicum]|uniref:Arylsulfatase n=1 Tax=Bifidobacterium gallicum DSM 20093 = LMG 11596 TaxID=561180 RepID=D1NVT7_9BIFI|nr:LTA synthase family protein [Bifidobacterium gallicum]EFA22938.1 arylsulfatase [Bifidobacterium gallicum DSM 20093 = LMG 11596]KFI59368.1 phosphoglycerol transferase [Bifidobacterium gallicum DSM 20093 = LMG 11596]